MHRQVGAEALRRHHLKHVSGPDVFQAFLDGCRVATLGKVAGEHRGRARAVPRHPRQRAFQAAGQALGHRFSLRLPGGHRDHEQLVAQVIKHHHAFGHDEQCVGHVQLVRVAIRQVFVAADQIVGRVAHRAADEGGQASRNLDFAPGAAVKQAQRVRGGQALGGSGFAQHAGKLRHAAAQLEPTLLAYPDKAVAPQPLARFHRFEQKAYATVLGGLQVGRHGRVEVGGQLTQGHMMGDIMPGFVGRERGHLNS